MHFIFTCRKVEIISSYRLLSLPFWSERKQCEKQLHHFTVNSVEHGNICDGWKAAWFFVLRIRFPLFSPHSLTLANPTCSHGMNITADATEQETLMILHVEATLSSNGFYYASAAGKQEPSNYSMIMHLFTTCLRSNNVDHIILTLARWFLANTFQPVQI